MRSRFLMFFAIASIGIAGCSDPCDDVTCLNGGACNDGTCVCPTGFTGEFCQTVVVPPNPCENVNCGSNGECVDGTCVCDEGYEGANCGTVSRDKFLGTYSVSESCTNGTDAYTMTIAASSTSVQQVTVTNLYDAPQTVVATVSGNSITIGSQTVNGITYTGTGSINSAGNTLTMTYQLSDGINSDSCTLTATK
ncbi:MAG: hypothetical protein K9J06_12380 [Flavobacteriales bacterium]|nr:hypothetical protein [Flavobacteriales bacterium]